MNGNFYDLEFFGLEPRKGKRKLVDWNEVREWIIEQGTVISFKEIKAFILRNYDKQKVYYSEIDRFIQSVKEDNNYIVVDGLKKVAKRKQRFVGIFPKTKYEQMTK